ncbi:hypothetical protein JDV02_004821 [Purpureocillium takamizusanense]|uniref:TauD/TfdA-like domain-containing protein n=1 Tax=Purpureocillium takamizusanense TaxID=2060973 RepID=A0A9Q8VB58_9HYPO|nr:uncharacterized protein JDV02_004821 [Purpureocillium takamizusanense]UNI18561.1 hypothetical protein JDV02_004821 [Purpureocillium takamizusanense]
MLSPTRIAAGPRLLARAVSSASCPVATTIKAPTAPASRAARTAALHTQRGGRGGRVLSQSTTTSAERYWPKYEIPEGASRLVYDLKSSSSSPSPSGGDQQQLPPITVAWTRDFLFVQDSPERGRRALKPATLRDSCACPRCRDPTSGQKSFASTEIPVDIGIADVRALDEGLAITFDNDMARDGEHHHETVLPWTSVEMALKRRTVKDMPLPRKRSVLRRTGVQYWDAATLGRHVRSIDYAAYMEDGGEAFWDAVIDICRLGIVYLHNVPRDEESVVRITTRMANIRETFYGRTFDVRAKPDAENVAYTSGYLGLHQDLMYLDPPPMIQVLHCMDNSCAGGESLFSDGERVGRLLWPFVNASARLAPLADHHIPYQYDKNGHHYFASRYVIDHTEGGGFAGVHWSPPFQGRYLSAAKDLRPWIEPARVFEGLVNDPAAVYSRKMEPGECVLFDNLRTMHGRTAFDVAGATADAAAAGGGNGSNGSGGARWLRGAYIAAEDFLSRASHIPAGQAEAYRGPEEWTPENAQRELRETAWHQDVLDRVRKLDPGLTE